MAGAITKHYYAEKLGYNKEDIVFVSLMPGIDRKHEASREEMEYKGIRDVDYVLTTREYARLLKRKGISLMRLEEGTAFGELAKLTASNSRFTATEGYTQTTLKTASLFLIPTPVSETSKYNLSSFFLTIILTSQRGMIYILS